MTAFLVAALLFALLVLAVVLLPLLRGAAPAPERETFDRAVYRDQLAELERDQARGVIGPAEAEAARLEIQRRLLRSTAEAKPAAAGRAPALAVALALLAASGAGLVYMSTGAPGLPAMPFAQRPVNQEEQALRQSLLDLERRVREAPGDGQAWVALARTLSDLAQWREADVAWRRALALVPAAPELVVAALEARVLATDGIVGQDAAEGFRRLLAEDPGNPVARFYLATADAQAGRHQAAIDAWRALAADLPAEVPIRAEIARRIAATASAAGIPAPAMPAPAAAPDATAQQAMIRGMVDRLAARLETEPGDADGWQRLGRAWAVLGEREKSAAAYARAGALRPDDLAIALAEAQSLMEGLAPEAPTPPRALPLLKKVIAGEPDNATALWLLGVEAAKRRAMDEAAGYWDRLVAILPPDSRDAQMVRAALAAIRR